MSSKHRSHEECVQPSGGPAPAGSPRLHVQRSPSRDTLTIRFSALGKEEEGEEPELELCPARVPASRDTSSVATAVEACEEVLEEEAEDGVSPPRSGRDRSSPQVPRPPPSKSLSFPSSDRASAGVAKSLSSDLGAPAAAAPALRHRQLMKTLVKSLSSDTSQDSSSVLAAPYRLPEARLNLQLFRQFTQPRPPPAGDPRTAPCSPLTSPDRGSFFKVSEVEARFEDTRRRLSEAISEPLQLLSKIMDEKGGGGGACRPKALAALSALSAGASELSGPAAANGRAENNNNNYCIKEEEGAEWESQRRSGASSPSVCLEKCSMSALARQEDDDFCVLYSDDCESAADAGGAVVAAGRGSGEEGEAEGALPPPPPPPSLPLAALGALTLLVYAYLVLPLPTYVAGLVLGAGLGFLLAICVVWLTGLKPSHCASRRPTDWTELWTLSQLDIKEPEMYKVSKDLMPLA